MNTNIQITQIEFDVNSLEWKALFLSPSHENFIIPIEADKAKEIIRHFPNRTIEKKGDIVFYLFV